MRLCFAIVTIWLAASAGAFGATMGEVVGAIALNCMGQVDERAKLEAFFQKEGTRLRPEHADPMLKPDTGAAYLSKYDNGGQMIAGVLDAGGCKIFSKEADRAEIVTMLGQRFKPQILVRQIFAEPSRDGQVLRETYTVLYRGKRMFLRILGPANNAGVAVEVLPLHRPPSGIPPERIAWPE